MEIFLWSLAGGAAGIFLSALLYVVTTAAYRFFSNLRKFKKEGI